MLRSLASITTTALIAACQVGAADSPSPNYGSGAIKTRDGYIHVYNGNGTHYTLAVTGDRVRITSTKPHILFAVDGKFLQIHTVHVRKFLDKDSAAEQPRTQLTRFKEWEVAHLEELYGTPLKTTSSWVRLETGQEALLWHFEVPPTPEGNVREQFYLAQLVGSRVVLLNSGVASKLTSEDVRAFLVRIGQALSVSDDPIDLNAISAQAKSQSEKIRPE